MSGEPQVGWNHWWAVVKRTWSRINWHAVGAIATVAAALLAGGAVLVSALAWREAQRQVDLQGEQLAAQTDPLIVEVPYGEKLPQPVTVSAPDSEGDAHEVTNIGQVLMPGETAMLSLPIQNIGGGPARVTQMTAAWNPDRATGSGYSRDENLGTDFYLAAGTQRRVSYAIGTVGAPGEARVKILYENLRGTRHRRTTLIVGSVAPHGQYPTPTPYGVWESSVRRLDP
jgi:hypothetical protein